MFKKQLEALIDEFDKRLEAYPDKSTWQKTNMADWYPWLIEEGPAIVKAVREMAGILSLIPREDLDALEEKWDRMLQLIDNDDTFSLAMKYKKKKIAE